MQQGGAMTRFTIDIDDQFNKTLESLANGGSKADVVRRAVQTYNYLKHEVPNNQTDKRVSITNVASNIEKDILLP
jgi:metal-responsive CopG/Arc/MetJ family transcriptional regulator